MSFVALKQKLFQYYLIQRCRPAPVTRRLQSELPARIEPGPPDRRRIRVAALQVELRLISNPFEFADHMHRQVRRAAENGAQLAVLPEYSNLHFLGLLPGIKELSVLQDNPIEQSADFADISLAEIFRFMSPAVEPLVHAIFSRLASAYAIYIMAGSYVVDDHGRAMNRAFLYDSSGALVGSQDKVHLIPEEVKWNIGSGSSFSIFETRLGNFALPVCMDASYYEPFRIMELKKADIALVPIAEFEEYNDWMALRGIWSRVQESLLYGVKSVLVGEIAGFKFAGRAGIYAPLELTPQKDGILAEVEFYDREAIAVADLDLEALENLRRKHPWRDQNPALYSRYFPALYSKSAGSGTTWNRSIQLK